MFIFFLAVSNSNNPHRELAVLTWGMAGEDWDGESVSVFKGWVMGYGFGVTETWG